MIPDTSRWRSSSTYDYVDDLSGPDFAWEWLRRNSNYQADYQATQFSDADRERVTNTLRSRWGLHFRHSSRSQRKANQRLLVTRHRHLHGAISAIAVLGSLQTQSPERFQCH
ncbi:DUF6499 domain-containing protein [Sinorhizobium garamanticum]|uniref:DUF6499 domain-containing protein n=2 Tax=Sinorhizobium garamanticum TaxID=680247 RepID=A0ABY8D4J8_9HYPH|nr:DUF6499 domain-containing protein [Sinorhizobium garamanticum]WEX85779.1 DUF6499 domain-containing protein [Sinorhizobium garamanticum]